MDAAALPAQLAAALRDGPFDVALDLAIRRSGLPLEALQRRLAQRGAEVSQATLSYWRHGRRRPEGDRSLRAVQVLEGCLGVDPDGLSALIGPARPRGRWLSHASMDLPTVLGLEPAVLVPCTDIDLDGNNRLSIASLHERSRIGADRTELSVLTELVVVSKTDGVDRWVCFFYPAGDGVHHPSVVRTENCRPARVRTDPDSQLLAVELRFDYPLSAGQTYVFAFEIGYTGDRPHTARLQYGLRTPARQLMLQVSFDASAVPVRCYRYLNADPGQPPRESELPIGPSGTTHFAELNARPGAHGIRWEWT
ncbi:helix-turn-helix domain-containing protein [Streptomyces sp. NBC_00503]|uniref:helix-turn-helix domain-containing protein n=1 Tax=Streptomyces sp. NBC_00503 TaxID=2903659 RepID=UPI002E7FF4F1|nr:helix-turn-helix transcriptional regulator [Streptomyces sp. NBC_00503]WUD79143.1 helix-turn-helix transcriptional regulator [Streptomyces sp. NBC_00503]